MAVSEEFWMTERASLKQERDDAIRQYAQEGARNLSLEERIAELEKERDQLIQAVADHVTARCELAAQNEALRSALQDCVDMPKAHSPIRKAVLLLNLPNLAAEVLKRRDAETLRRAAERLQSDKWAGARELRNMAAELEKETTSAKITGPL